MPKKDCKYWDKCYQRNEQHLQKYNHPKNESQIKNEVKTNNNDITVAPKRKISQDQKGKPGTEDDRPNSSGVGSSTNRDISKHCVDSKEELIDIKEKYEISNLREEVLANISGKKYMEIIDKRIKLSIQQEYDHLCESNEFIRHKFLVEMPPDFFDFWNFISEYKKENANKNALFYLEEQFHLKLVGPFEFLAGRFHGAQLGEPGDYLRHWRFYYDPPEFQTMFVRCGTGVHYGYWRDTPQDKEKLMIARNDASVGCEFEFVAGNIFDAFLYYLEKDFVNTPFTAANVATIKKKLRTYIQLKGIQLEKLDKLQKERNKKIVTKTFHRAGIVVPLERSTQLGYRPLIVSDVELKKILNQLAENRPKIDADVTDKKINIVKQNVLERLQPIANAAHIAVDESDFGTALELGIDLFCSGYKEVHNVVTTLLVPAYSMLSRPQFIAILKAHMDDRSHNFNLSIFDVLDKLNAN